MPSPEESCCPYCGKKGLELQQEWNTQMVALAGVHTKFQAVPRFVWKCLNENCEASGPAEVTARSSS